MRKNFLIIGMITAAACTAVYGCAEKKEGPQTIIIELADPADIEESSMANESASTEVPESESESFAEEITTDSDERYPQIEGLSNNVTLSCTQIGSDDPIIGLVIADILPDIHAKDLDITNVQAYIDDEEMLPLAWMLILILRLSCINWMKMERSHQNSWKLQMAQSPIRLLNVAVGL